MKIFRAADAFYARRREGPYRFIQNRSRISVVALKSDAAAEKSKDRLREIFRVVRFSTFATISAHRVISPGRGIWSLSGHSGLWKCVHVYFFSGMRIASARYDNAQTIIRCGEPEQFQLSGFLACNRGESPMGSAMGDFTNCAMVE